MSPTPAVSPAASIATRKGRGSNTQSRNSIFSSPKPICDREVRVVVDRSLDITGSFLGIIVGKLEHRENFFLHERLFTSHSRFLEHAAKIERLQQKNVILLPEDDPTTFRLYAVLTYTSFLTTKDLPFEWQSLVDVYLLAERLEDPWAKNHVVDAMHSFLAEYLRRDTSASRMNSLITDYISVASLYQLYDGTHSGSQARKLVVDFFAHNGTEDWLAASGRLLPFEFLFDITVLLLRKRTPVVFGNMLKGSSSHYHEEFEEHEWAEDETPMTPAIVVSSQSIKVQD